MSLSQRLTCRFPFHRCVECGRLAFTFSPDFPPLLVFDYMDGDPRRGSSCEVISQGTSRGLRGVPGDLMDVLEGLFRVQRGIKCSRRLKKSQEISGLLGGLVRFRGSQGGFSEAFQGSKGLQGISVGFKDVSECFRGVLVDIKDFNKRSILLRCYAPNILPGLGCLRDTSGDFRVILRWSRTPSRDRKGAPLVFPWTTGGSGGLEVFNGNLRELPKTFQRVSYVSRASKGRFGGFQRF